MAIENQLDEIIARLDIITALLGMLTTPKSAPAKPVPSVDYKSVAQAIESLAEAKGFGEAQAVLARFGARTGKDVAEDKWSAVIAACEAAKLT